MLSIFSLRDYLTKFDQYNDNENDNDNENIFIVK